MHNVHCFSNTLEITLDRSCCHPTESNAACPADYSDIEVVKTDTYTKYFTRCKDDLCNDGPGNDGGTIFS